MSTVIISASVLFLSAQGKKQNVSFLLMQNIEALAVPEGGNGNYNWGKHPCPGWWFLNGSERCCISDGEGNNCTNPGECTGC